VILSWLFACGAPATDTNAYVDALRLLRDDPVAAAERCASVGGAAGDECVAFAAAGLAAAGDPDRGLALCDRAASPVWKDECGFLVAEETADAQGFEAGARRCGGAGRFVDACLMHVWKSHATRLVAGSGPAAAAAAYAPALGWADAVIPWDAATTERFWDLYFDASFGSTTRTGPDPGHLEAVAAPAALDLALCDTLPELPAGDVSLPARCRASLPQSLMRALNRADHRPADVPGALDAAALCAPDGTIAERIARATDVRYVSSPDLDAVADRFVARRCAQEPR
jgi:hypothetical protein